MTHDHTWEIHPAWNRDHSRIAFVRGVDPEVIWTMWPDGSHQRRVRRGVSPAWSPDGRWLAYTRRDHVFVVRLATGGVRQLTFGNFLDGNPSWSPDGQWIVFDRATPAGDSFLYVMPAGGGTPEALDTGGDGFDPDWSPDGRSIAFASQREGSSSIYSFDLIEGTTTRITQMHGDLPSWAPGGKRIVFMRFPTFRSLHTVLFTIRPDGTDPTRLVRGGSPDW